MPSPASLQVPGAHLPLQRPPLHNDSCAPVAHLAHVPECFRLPLLPLQRRGFKVYVLPLERKDWFKVGRALFTRAYWSTSCTTHPGYTW